MDKRDVSLSALETEIGLLIGRARRVVGERARMIHPDMQAGSYLILGFVQTNGPVRATAIGEAFAIDKGSISRHVQQLIDLGLVEREPDPRDGRAILLTTTELAARHLDEIAQIRRETFAERLSGWSEAELATFAESLARYNVALSEHEAS